MHEDFQGPFWSADLIGANGKLARLHKGGAPSPMKPPPPVRQSNRQSAQVSENERMRAAKRRGYAATTNTDRSLLSAEGTGSKSLLG